jgi:hypothetical protein
VTNLTLTQMVAFAIPFALVGFLAWRVTKLLWRK